MSLSLVADIGGVDEPALKRMAHALWPHLLTGDLIALDGDLGAGKSTFARALIRAALTDTGADVPSPTFTLVQAYDTPTGQTLLHSDLYRVENKEEVAALGLEDALETGMVVVEWPDRLPPHLLGSALWIKLDHDRETRRVRAAAPQHVSARLQSVWPGEGS